jgi:Flp pilus assembly protein TadD
MYLYQCTTVWGKCLQSSLLALSHTMGLEEELRASVGEMLLHYLFDDAIFLTERLCDEYGGLPNTLLLATCYMRAGRFGTVCSYLKAVCGHLLSGPFEAGSAVEWRVRYTYISACVQLKQFEAAKGCFEGMDGASAPGMPQAALYAMKAVCYAGSPTAENYALHAAASCPMLLKQFQASVPLSQPQGPPVPLLTYNGSGPFALSIYPLDAPMTRFLRPFAEVIAALEKYQFSMLLPMLASPSLERHSSFTSLVRAVRAAHSAQHADAASLFAPYFRDHPWKLSDPSVILYSNCLWQLKEPHTLGSLSHHVINELGRHPVALAVTANLYSLEGETQSAISTLQHAVALDDRLVPAHILLGLELLHVGNFSDAARCFQAAVRCGPSSYLAYTGLGDVARATKSDPIPMYEKALQLNHYPYTICQCADVLLDRGLYPHALNLINKAVEGNPLSVTCRSRRALILAALDRLPEAIADLKYVLSLEPGEADTWFHYGRCCLHINQVHEATVAFNTAVVLDPRRRDDVHQLLLAHK